MSFQEDSMRPIMHQCHVNLIGILLCCRLHESRQSGRGPAFETYSCCLFSDFSADGEGRRGKGRKPEVTVTVSRHLSVLVKVQSTQLILVLRTSPSFKKPTGDYSVSRSLSISFTFPSTFRPISRHAPLSAPCSLQPPLVRSPSFTLHPGAHPSDLFLCYCLFYGTSILPFFPLSIFSLNIETSAESYVSPARVYFGRKEGKTGWMLSELNTHLNSVNLPFS